MSPNFTDRMCTSYLASSLIAEQYLCLRVDSQVREGLHEKWESRFEVHAVCRKNQVRLGDPIWQRFPPAQSSKTLLVIKNRSQQTS